MIRYQRDKTEIEGAALLQFHKTFKENFIRLHMPAKVLDLVETVYLAGYLHGAYSERGYRPK